MKRFFQRFVPMYHGFLNKIRMAFGHSIVIDDASDEPLVGLRLFGKSTQNGTPTLDAPMEIVSVENPTIGICSKNFIPKEYSDGQSITHNGITFIVNGDNSVTLNGVATDRAYFYFNKNRIPLQEGQLIVSSGIGYSDTEPFIQADIYVDGEYTSTIQTLSKGASTNSFKGVVELGACRISVPSGFVANNVKVYPIVSNSNQPLSVPYILHGIPVTSGGNYTDANGQQWICDEVDFERGVYVQRVRQKTFDGSEQLRNDWFPIMVFNTENPNLYAIPSVKPLCNYFTKAYIGNQGGSTLAIGGLDKLGFTNILEVQTFMSDCHRDGNPIVIQYALATPIETPLTADQIAAYKALHTNEPNTTISNDQGAWMSVSYISK